MEAVPRLHMLWFTLKSSPEGTSFANLKKYIAEFYQEDADSYSKEVFALETLRNQAMHPTKDGCSVMKRYYCQLHSLQNRFPQLSERGIFTFTWKDLYQSNVNEMTDMRFEMAAVLFNIAASHTQVGASVTRGDVDGMKLACTHFQCAAWAFGELRERYANVNSGGDFMTTELLVFMQQVSFAQAQECILEKSLIDNRKPNIVAKVTAQIAVYYGAALAALLTGGDDGPISQVIDSSVYKLWKKYVRFKISYLNCILYLYQGQHSEEQQKMGERVTLYQAAWEKLEEARKESKGLPDQKEINESIIFTADVVEAKRKNAKNENEFIYHEAVPELSSISAVQGANLVNGISFSVTDPEVAGDDIFARLVPMKAHEASSMYSEEKAKLLRKYGAKIEEKDLELTSFMSSLTLENLNISEEKANKIPQGIVDRCAALNANKSAIPDLIAAMSQLAEICADVEMNLKEIASILTEEELQEQEFQKATGVKRTPNAHITELTREFQKYNEAHARAGESNDTLRKAMELHVNNLKILARPLQDIQQSVPKLSTELNTAEIFKDVKLILNKSNEMKAQRAQFHSDLRIAVNDDDITTKVIAHGTDEGLQTLFDRELSKHERLTQLIDQNLLAQKNILQALTESYAKAAPVLKTLADVKHKRESFFSSLAASYDVYEDLLAKSAKGLEFYKKLSGNVQKLLTRFKSARDVQSEERQQHLKSVTSSSVSNSHITPIAAAVSKDIQAPSAMSSNTPKLRDYLKAKNTNAASIAAAGSSGTGSIGIKDTTNSSLSSPYIPPIRPSPLGSENPTQAVCSGSYYPAVSINTSTAPNEPPPPYSLQQTQYYDPNAIGYTNPMYQQQQQNIAPPAYKLQASPNSQFTTGNVVAGNLNANMANLSLQSDYNQLAAQQQQQAQYNAALYTQQPQALANMYGANMLPMQQHQQQPQQQQLQQQPMPNYNYGVNAHQQQLSNMPNVAASAPAAPVAYATPTYFQNAAAANQMQSQQLQQQLVVNPNTPLNQYSPNLYDPSIGGLNYTQATPTGLLSAQQMAVSNISAVQQGYTLQQNPQYAAPSQVTPPPPMSAEQSYGATPTSVPAIAPTINAPTVAAIPTTQPLYIATTMQDATQMVSSPPVAPSSLQAPYVVNAMQSNNPATATHQTLSNTPPHATADSKTPYANYGGNTKHPGYSFNTQTGQYEYGSGYQQAAANNKHFYGQYTSASDSQKSAGTTDSENAHKTNLATGFDSPIVSHTKRSSVTETQGPSDNALHYYTPPYGHQSNGLTAAPNDAATGYDITQLQQLQKQSFTTQQNLQQPQTPPQPQQEQQQLQQQQQNPARVYEQHSIYMQSGSVSIAKTQTTKSAAEYTTSSQHSTPKATPTASAEETTTPAQPTAAKAKPAAPVAKKSSNIDLLTDIDFSGAGLSVPPPILPTPTLKPEIVASPPPSQVGEPTTSVLAKTEQRKELEDKTKVLPIAKSPSPPPAASAVPLTPSAATNTALQELSSPIASPAALHKSSIDNISICSDLSSLDNNFDWDSASVVPATTSATNATTEKQQHSTDTFGSSAFLLKPFDPFADSKTLKYFHKEVERYEKIIESLNVKMLNGNTQLSAKWKELHELLAKDATKRTTSISKLFPEKNRSLDCIPYDHARVKLEKNTDDYINAAYIKNLGTGCPNFIIAQTPQQNTINDFWSMLWSQKARTVLCLHTPNEMLDPYWPQELDKETHFDDFSVKCVKVNMLSHCAEYNLKLSMHGADAIIDLSVLQIKAWTKNLPTQVLGIARNVLQAHQQHCLEFNTPQTPLIMNCLTGSERSEVIAIAICTILATQNKRPILINVVDVWQRICAQRQNALRDTATLEQSMHLVLNHAHDVLNKRGIMTSYQMKIAPQVASKEKEEIKDPLNELDPLWKLK